MIVEKIMECSAQEPELFLAQILSYSSLTFIL